MSIWKNIFTSKSNNPKNQNIHFDDLLNRFKKDKETAYDICKELSNTKSSDTIDLLLR